jgi:hypothetical protein
MVSSHITVNNALWAILKNKGVASQNLIRANGDARSGLALSGRRLRATGRQIQLGHDRNHSVMIAQNLDGHPCYRARGPVADRPDLR